jgi:hypothetical protein
MKAFVIVFVLAASLVFAQDVSPPDFIFAPGSEGVRKSIERYCLDVDALTLKLKPTILVADDVTPTWSWRQLRTDNRAEIDFSVPLALVWKQGSQVVAVKLWTPNLGSRFHPACYCFRMDGSVARVIAAPRRSPPKLRKVAGVGREWIFDVNGKTIFEAFNRFDSSPLKSETTYHVYPEVKLYKHVGELPFADIISDTPAMKTRERL